MSLWRCPACAIVYGNIYMCPTCGAATEFVTMRTDGNNAPTQTLTVSANRLDAALGVLEALQADGYWLHDVRGKRLEPDEFSRVVAKAFDAVLAGSRS